MDSDLVIGIVVVVAIGGALLMFFRVLAESTHRFRVRLFENAEAALNDRSVSDHEKAMIEDMLYLSEVPAGGWMIVRAYARAAFGRRSGVANSAEAKFSERLGSLTVDFALATLGANPVALIAAIPMILAFSARRHMAVQRAMRTGASQEVPRVICNA